MIVVPKDPSIFFSFFQIALLYFFSESYLYMNKINFCGHFFFVVRVDLFLRIGLFKLFLVNKFLRMTNL